MKIEEFKLNIKWWEDKRWIYNIAVGVIGVFTIYDGISRGEYSWTIKDTIGIIIWGIGANIFYSTGILLELFDWYYFKNKVDIKRLRLIFFLIGLVLSCFLTLLYGWLYFSKPYLW